MTTQYLTINSGDLLPLTKVKRVNITTDDDRKSLTKLNAQIDASRFQCRIDTAPKGKIFSEESIDDLARQGVAFVQVDERAFIPAINIVKARNITPEDRIRFHEKTGREMRAEFKAQVETQAGNVLATITAETVMDRINNPYVPQSGTDLIQETAIEIAPQA